MSNTKSNKRKKRQDRNSLGGSGTSSYYRNKRLIETGETFRSRKCTGPEQTPGHYRPFF